MAESVTSFVWTPEPQDIKTKGLIKKAELSVRVTNQLIEHDGLDAGLANAVANRVFQAVDAAYADS